ncbi:type II-A CRISPR-associated protein Csn2 [Sneathia sanguinegens]|uniref:Type II-A CRISPR-associated protein Csn2 n=1 Tax=Sneathia sanguinegens TaxID=40543 RepID=A0ABT7HJB5_9FUSO|nr:type II-A CRISPR-associated protein Csn2 [Sneathia sanguinegens]MDK9580611.1 type II-A CRISPR-associated protein Csn2 [Sneathia sanguinegens]
MNLQIKGFDFLINLENNINILVIENKKFYREIVNTLLNKLDIKNGNILLSNETELLEPHKNLFTFYDYYSFDINKYCLTKLYKKIRENTLEEYFDETNIIKHKIEEYIYKIIEDYGEYLEINGEIDIVSMLKSLDVKIKNYPEISIDKLIDYMCILSELFNIDNFCFINLKDIFSEEELIEFYKYIRYNDFKVVLVENKKSKILKTENTFVIDEDLCEIY